MHNADNNIKKRSTGVLDSRLLKILGGYERVRRATFTYRRKETVGIVAVVNHPLAAIVRCNNNRTGTYKTVESSGTRLYYV